MNTNNPDQLQMTFVNDDQIPSLPPLDINIEPPSDSSPGEETFAPESESVTYLIPENTEIWIRSRNVKIIAVQVADAEGIQANAIGEKDQEGREKMITAHQAYVIYPSGSRRPIPASSVFWIENADSYK